MIKGSVLFVYEHHKQSIKKLINYFKEDNEVIAIILGGSIAKGLERVDSDIDAIIVTTQNKYDELSAMNKLSECIWGYCNYDGGYFDIKYCTKSYLFSVESKGSEPSRNAFLCSKCIYSKDDEISLIVSEIPVFQKSEKQEKMLSFYSAFNLNYGYFWNVSENNIYLRVKTAADIILFGFRLLLQENEVLFPCHKSLRQTVSELKNKPKDIIEKSDLFLSKLDDSSKDDFVSSILNFIDFIPPKDYNVALTRFIDDNELWWYKNRPIIAEW